MIGLSALLQFLFYLYQAGKIEIIAGKIPSCKNSPCKNNPQTSEYKRSELSEALYTLLNRVKEILHTFSQYQINTGTVNQSFNYLSN